MNHPITRELTRHEHLKNQLIKEYPDIDDETLMDTLEGMTNLKEQLSAIVRSQQEDRVHSQALKTRISEMQERQRRFEHRLSQKRDFVASVMKRAGLNKIAEDDFTVSLRASVQQLVISDEASIPNTYWKPQSPKLDRQLLINDLKSEMSVQGASLKPGNETISVRVK